MKVLIVICDRNLSSKILKLLDNMGIFYHISCYAKGTANSEILAYFGLAETEKELIISFIKNEDTKKIMDSLSELEFVKNHGAVAFTIPVNGIGKKTLEFIKKLEEKNE